MIVFAAITPHPPVSIPGVGDQGELQAISATLAAMRLLRRGLEESKPDTVIIISPHAHLDRYAFSINVANPLEGDFEAFGVGMALAFTNDIPLADSIAYCCSAQDIPCRTYEGKLDYGALIPLYHLTPHYEPHLVHLSFSMLDYQKHFDYGEAIGGIVKGSEKRIAVIASGDLSHRLTPDAPAGFSPTAKWFDQRVIDLLRHGDIKELMLMQQDFVSEAAECGMRSFLILYGILNGMTYEFKQFSYEAPFGVGYLAARLV